MGPTGMMRMPGWEPPAYGAANWMTFDIDPIGKTTGRKRHRLTLLLSAAMLLHAAAPASAETLMDAVEAAYARNPTLVEQRYRQKSTNETYVQTRAQYGPTLSIQATGDYR